MTLDLHSSNLVQMLVLVDQDSPQDKVVLPEGQYGTGGNGGGENTQTNW